MREHLLTPSLTAETKPSVSLYSSNSSLAVSIFGGAPAVIMISILNSYRLKRLADAPVYLAALGAWAAMVYAALHPPAPQPLDWLFSNVGVRSSSSLLAILLCGGFYALHRKQHRTSTMFQAAPSPWIPGIACCLLAWGLKYIAVQIFSSVGGA